MRRTIGASALLISSVLGVGALAGCQQRAETHPVAASPPPPPPPPPAPPAPSPDDQLQAQLGRLNAAAGSQGWTVSLGSGKFSGLNVTFDPRDTAHFDEIVDILKNSPNLRLQIEAFPANHGSPSHRREVAQAHADSVLRAFTRHGADEARIQAFAAATAAAPPAAGKRSNPRQIEIIFSDAEGEFRQAAASR